MSAPTKNANAAKGPETRSSHLHIRVAPHQKAAWVKAAQRDGKGLSDWVISQLDGAL